MDKKNKNLKKFAIISLIVLTSIISFVISNKFLIKAKHGFVTKNREWITPIMNTLIFLTTFFTVFFYLKSKDFLFKTGLICILFIGIGLVLIYSLYESGFLDKIDSVDDLREYISSYGAWTTIVFLLVQILQVTVVPIPGVITIGAGVLLYGAFIGALLSFVGIMIGSLIAFYIGRKLGYKVASWLVGENNLRKTMELTKGKDKVVLSFMFLLPFFPDDLLCFVSGLSSMSVKFFVCMLMIARLISIFSTAYSLNGSLIPFNTWWGILIWACLIVFCLFAVKIVYKKSEKIEKIFKTRKNKEKPTQEN